MMDFVKKNWAWGVAALVGVALFAGPFAQLFRLALRSSEHSHTILIPWVSLYLIWINRRAVFALARPAPAAGVALLAAGAGLRVLGSVLEGRLDANDFLVFTTAGGWLYLLGLFVGTSGPRAFRAALFPLLFAVLMVPLPTAVLNGFVTFLQVWSAEAAELIFSWAGIPFVREGMVFALTGISIEVAEQCSGIRSSLVLLIIGILVAYLYLKSGWRRILFVLAVIPVTIFKNGLRIAMLGYLGSYVDTAYVTNSALHHSGGYGFMVVALAMMAPVLFALRWGEKRREAIGEGRGAIGEGREAAHSP